MIGTVVSHYKILEKLGEGGMGIVYKAQDLKLNRIVALKFLPHHLAATSEEQERFLQEAKAAALLNHPNVCIIYDIKEEAGQQFIVMEYVEGLTLREKFAEGGKWQVSGRRPEAAIGYAIQIAEALQEAHAHGIVHRDVKSENIMVNAKNQIKVMDFGLAKLKGSLKLTRTSSTIGTLAYMAPEQIHGREVDARSDIFSFGIVLYEMLTGRLPFRGEHEAAMVYSIVNEEPEPLLVYLPDAPSGLVHILQRALAKDPDERYQTAHDMLIDLRLLKKDSTRVSKPENDIVRKPLLAGTGSPLPPAKKSRTVIWVALAGSVLILGIIVLILVQRQTEVRLNPNRTSVALSVPLKFIDIPSLSADGRWMAFPGVTEDFNWYVYMMNTAGSQPRHITEQEKGAFINCCDISRDLSTIAYDISIETGPSQIRVISSEGGTPRTVADTGGYPKWRPDGQRIGYIRTAGNPKAPPHNLGKFEIWSVRPDGTDKRIELTDTLSAFGPFAFSWSPDGGSIAWVATYPEGYSEVRVRDLATDRQWQITHDKMHVDEVVWATNGQILFVSDRSGQTNLWMVPAQGGAAEQISQGTVPVVAARISADNKRMIWLQQENIRLIWVCRIDGSSARQITSDDIRTLWATFSPDGSTIAAVVGDVDVPKQQSSLCVMDRNGMNRRTLTAGSEHISFCRWSPDGKWLAYVSRAVNEPEDSDRVCLIQPAGPAGVRMLCRGHLTCWIDDDNLAVVHDWKTWQYSLTRGRVRQLYQDSTVVFAVRGAKNLLYEDKRNGHGGWWVTSTDSLGKGSAKSRSISLPESPQGWAVTPDLRSVVYQKDWTGIRRLKLTGIAEEQIGSIQEPGMRILDVSKDGKFILWLKYAYRSKLSMIENPFE